MVVERARGESQSVSGSLQSLCWGSSAFGGVVSSYFSGSLVESYGVRFVFGVTALLPLITSAVAVLVNEQRVVRPASGQKENITLVSPGFLQTSKQNMNQLWNAIKQPNVFLPTLFIFLWQATPHSDSVMFYLTTNKLGFTPEFLGRVKLVTSIASLLGVGLYNGFLKTVPLREIFDNHFRHRSRDESGFLHAGSCVSSEIVSIRNGSNSLCYTHVNLQGLMGAGLTQVFGITRDSFDNLSMLIILCNLSSLLPLPLLGLLPKDSPDAVAKDNADIEMKSN